MIKPLWESGSTSLESSVFVVQPGQTAVLTAVGFGKYVKRVEATDVKISEAACLHRVLFETSSNNDRSEYDQHCLCGGVLDLDSMGSQETKLISDQLVLHCGCPLGTMTMGSNIMLIGLPGNYRFEFNSEDMIGKANIYLELFDNDKLPNCGHNNLYF